MSTMSAPLATPARAPCTIESRAALPEEVARLLAAAPGTQTEAAWSAFLSVYSPLLLRVASAFGPGYDEALDRYAHMLDELRRDDCRRLRRFSADGRSRFSTWLVVVARRLCLDHYRLRYGRTRGNEPHRPAASAARTTRRCLSDLADNAVDLTRLADPTLPDPGDRLDAECRRLALARATRALSPGDQLLLRLRFEDDLSAKEIAALLGMPTPFHVYRRLAGVCARLRLHLESTAMARPA
jgi:RNA polymerase sigma factor (sigma-70 family)